MRDKTTRIGTHRKPHQPVVDEAVNAELLEAFHVARVVGGGAPDEEDETEVTCKDGHVGVAQNLVAVHGYALGRMEQTEGEGGGLAPFNTLPYTNTGGGWKGGLSNNAMLWGE